MRVAGLPAPRPEFSPGEGGAPIKPVCAFPGSLLRLPRSGPRLALPLDVPILEPDLDGLSTSSEQPEERWQGAGSTTQNWRGKIVSASADASGS